MNKKCAALLVFASSLTLLAGLASAAPGGHNLSQDRMIPVLVSVDTHGKVTQAKPAYKLRPAFQRSIRHAVARMISKPAMEHGKPVASQFVVNLAMTLVPLNKNAYRTSFKYVSSKPLPHGSWYWVRGSQGRLALANQGSSQPIYVAQYAPPGGAGNPQSWMTTHRAFMQKYGAGR